MASTTMTTLTIQCAWLNRRGMSRFAASVDAAENPGINPGIVSKGDSMHDEPGSNPRAWSRRTWPRWGVAATLWCLLHGCDTVSGGAVELSWKLRPASSSLEDKFVDCNSGHDGTGPVARIRLHWE